MLDPLNDGISGVAVIDYMGDDVRVANAARVSMAKQTELDSVGCLKEPDARLLGYLAKHGHWTPFSHVMVTLHLRMPIFIARQWFKHQVGFTRNEVSRRYVDDAPAFYIPTEWRERAANVKQGSSDTVSAQSLAMEVCAERSAKQCRALYTQLLEAGACPEQARLVLPQTMYTEFYETASLAAYARLCGLRLDPHAQKEVRLYAETANELIRPVAPTSWDALMESNT